MSSAKLLRVSQINAIFFDKEIYALFKQNLSDLFRYLPPTVWAKYESELSLLIKLAIFNYSVMQHNCTFGQKLLSIKYAKITYYQKMCYMFSYFYEYLKEKWGDSTSNGPIGQHLYRLHLFVQLLRFINISWFLRNGEKPLLVERIVGLDQVYSSSNAVRHYEDKYMTRELIWNGLIEVLVYLLPLINYHKINRIVKNFNPLHIRSNSKNNRGHKVVQCKVTKETFCDYCDESPVIPCHMGCSHVFCYYCLKGNQKADSKFECPKCEYQNGENVLCEKVCC